MSVVGFLLASFCQFALIVCGVLIHWRNDGFDDEHSCLVLERFDGYDDSFDDDDDDDVVSVVVL